MSTTDRFADYVRLTFAETRDSLTHSVRVLIAAQSLAPIRRGDSPTNLRSGATVKHLVVAFENHATQAVGFCRDAAKRSELLEAHLRTTLPAEVDALAAIVSERLVSLDLWDTAAKRLLAERRDRALAECRLPVAAIKAPIWSMARAWPVVPSRRGANRQSNRTLERASHASQRRRHVGSSFRLLGLGWLFRLRAASRFRARASDGYATSPGAPASTDGR